METDIRWIKISVNLFSDDKIRLIRAMEHGNEMILIWLQLLLLAGRVNQDGLLILSNTEVPYTEEMMASQFDVDLSTVHTALDVFRQFGMIEILDDIYHITNWSKHQSVDSMERIREQNRERKQAERERKRTRTTHPADVAEKSLIQKRFDRFWKVYPKKVGKGAAEKAFAKYKPTEELTETMIKAVEAAKRSTAWLREGGQYIPNPATWLNQRRWEDELTEAPAVTSSRRLEDWDE